MIHKHQVIEENFHLHIQDIPSKVPGMTVQHRPSISFVDCGLPCDTFNIVHIWNGSNLKVEELSQVKSYYQQKNSILCVWIAQTQLVKNANAVLNQAGFSQVNKEPGMYLDLSGYATMEHARHSGIRKISTLQEVVDFATIIAHNWEPPDQQVIRFYKEASQVILSPDNQTLYTVYYEGNTPVATLEMIPSGKDTIGLYSLSTLAAHRGKGIGTALMTYSLNYAKKLGFTHAVLQASEDGIGIYKRLGFEEVTNYYEYQLP
jgi:GNAT superfamily N-acetyltransferase